MTAGPGSRWTTRATTGSQSTLHASPEVAVQLFECLVGAAPSLGAITMPALVIRGELDTIVPPEATDALLNGDPGHSDT